MAKTEGTYIQVAYKNVFGYISTNSWPFFMIQRPTIREKCAWVRPNTWRDERPVFFGFSIFWQTSQLATEKIQNLCNHNRWSGLLRLGSVQFRSFFQSSELDLRTLQGHIQASCRTFEVMWFPSMIVQLRHGPLRQKVTSWMLTCWVFTYKVIVPHKAKGMTKFMQNDTFLICSDGSRAAADLAQVYHGFIGFDESNFIPNVRPRTQGGVKMWFKW